MVRGIRLTGMVFVAEMMFCLGAIAHTLPISQLVIVTDEDYVHLELSFNPFELARFSEFDTNKNARLDTVELESQGEKITRLLLDHLTLALDGKKVAVETAGVTGDADTHHATLRAHYRVKSREVTITVESGLQDITGIGHFTQVRCLREGKQALAGMDAHLRKATFAPEVSRQGSIKERRSNRTTVQKP